eukprot:TRINITY_DN2292_c0_g1_i1.p1 TRINITY_DN2292_c0_g1~~TRINITY_DN2292_c0_g1_i1.p1  ORF type:complete len:343 (+),score=144.90 TRINITY_DN2292_c0_g1_i1:47-1075(+)
MKQALCMAALVAAGSAEINFIGVGDFGGSGSQTSCERFTTEGQCSTAITMDLVAKMVSAEFIIGPGDLIYSDGLDNSGKAATDQKLRMENTFEKVYSPEKTPNLQVPWYVVAGNHDHHGDVNLEIDWYKQYPHGKWQFPSMYYAVHEIDHYTGTTMDFFMIDTEILVGENLNATSQEMWQSRFDQQRADEQLQWLEYQLERSSAHYVWVSGHYPIYSTCRHGTTWSGNLGPVHELMKKYKVTGYIGGHDHCLVDIQWEGMYHIITGMGGRSVYGHDRINDAPPGSEKWHIAGDNNGKSLGGFVTGSFNRTVGSISYWTDVDPVTGKINLEPLHVIEGIRPRF